MSRWIETDDGEFVNLDHVVKAKPVARKGPRGSDRHQLLLWLTDGTTVRTHGTGGDRPDYDYLFATILPALPGQEALTVFADVVERPTELWIERYPVIGWRVPLTEMGVCDGPEPILLETPASNVMVMIVLPDGAVLHVGGETTRYEDIETMKAMVLKEAQEDWDRHQAAKEARAAAA